MAKNREKKPVEPKLRPVQLLLTPEEHKALRMAAAAADMPMSKLVHKLVTDALEKK